MSTFSQYVTVLFHALVSATCQKSIRDVQALMARTSDQPFTQVYFEVRQVSQSWHALQEDLEKIMQTAMQIHFTQLQLVRDFLSLEDGRQMQPCCFQDPPFPVNRRILRLLMKW